MADDEEQYEDGEGEIELTPSQMEQLQQQMEEEGMLEEGEYDEEGEYYEDGEYYEGEMDEHGEYYEDGEGEYEGQYYEGEYEHGEEGQYEGEEEGHDHESEHVQAHKKGRKDKAEEAADIFEHDEPAHEELLRKIRRNLMDNLNRVRAEKELQTFYLELMLNHCAKTYSEHLCESGVAEPTYWDEFCINQFYKPLKEKDKQFPKDCHLCTIISKYEEDAVLNPATIEEFFMEMGYLFLEVEEDKQALLSPQMNHIGIGVEFDQNQISIVLAVTKRALAVTKVQEVDGVIEIRGKILEDKQGLFSVRIADFQQNNEITKIGPEKIDFSRQTKEFIASVEGASLDNGLMPNKLIELWNRQSPDSIPYKKQTREKLTYKYLDPQLKIPCFPYPDPRYAMEDIMREAEERKKQEQIELQRREKEEIEKANLKATLVEDEPSGGEDESEGREDSEAGFPQPKKPEQKEPVISNREIREDLELAIGEAVRQHDEFMEQNVKLQERIKQVLSKSDQYKDKSNEMAMNEHKYLNTLAHVHQIRLDLKQTQERYNKMAMELQQKLEEKQKKCQEIKYAFLELKREVAKKAAFSRNDKPIPDKQIEEWESKEMEKGQILQGLRLDILRLRNQYVKNQKVLKKKEELAEGLHLIDFEQLKIENQTLNEKIEERNEDLHKLKKKNTTTVQYLTHTREKLGFIQAKNEELKKRNLDYENELSKLTTGLSDLKIEKDDLRADTLRLKQQTGIVRSDLLKNDFEKLVNKVSELKLEKKNLMEKHQHMCDVIKQYKQQLKEQEAQMQYMEGV